MKFNRQILASIFLVLFGIIQLADLHIVGHDADDIDCSLCKFTSDHHNDNFTSADTVTVPEAVHVPADIVRATYVNRYFDSSAAYNFLNKAPPAA
ncbi:hypothetical protein IWQ47_004492 [Aquimarina sp. EL_43]|uniref:hypothetical protein n=1 Tax=Aquimarina TaxID=290174 RepID=UPI000472FCDA|nr:MULTISPECIES: hypothetical protein [Aquimarina]MBG6133174.1 hypothetical protein [Aquimarina sp. EL_35]MBG6153332.1 hypothetical protein [Aquimarina sp. EL_32]MBG6171399.1 hypothetical protein [Aquimarina sp. EL_43]